MEPGDCHHLIEQSAALRARSGETHQVSAEIILTSKELAAQTARLLEVTVSIRADAHGAVPAAVRRAGPAPGFWPGLVVRPSGLQRSPGSRDLPGGDAAGRSALDARGASLGNARQAGPGTGDALTAPAALAAPVTARPRWRTRQAIQPGPQAAGHRENRTRQPRAGQFRSRIDDAVPVTALTHWPNRAALAFTTPQEGGPGCPSPASQPHQVTRQARSSQPSCRAPAWSGDVRGRGAARGNVR